MEDLSSVTKIVTIHGYKVKPRITVIFTDSFLANKLFYDKIIYDNK